MMNKKRKNDMSKLFVERQQLTLGVKLVATFAMTYYSIFFILLTIFGYYYRSVYAPEFSEEPLIRTMIMNFILWFIVGAIVVSLILLLRRKRYGKFMFMTFTTILVVYQYITSDNNVWSIYIIEALMALIIAPLRVIAKFNKKLIDEIQTHKSKEEENNKIDNK